ncbi:DEAD/DEAH box helicase [Parvibacter caecicola]|uniref:DNA 3'-5' helicase n=1 Tax=Parvibacter caecicola TaxID=747645 RepID=A0A4T9TGE4_9ACTN|nr:DEAD/DEAH box helicase [Parvibacter caecicola]TJW09724.1 ATP-dependent DNA helicase RecQ [Parvibacter caecicola]
MEELFRGRVKKLIAQYEQSGKSTVLFFLGFSAWQSRIIMSLECALRVEEPWFDEEGYLEIGVIERTAKQMALSLSCNTGVAVGLYEHLIKLKDILPIMYEGRIVTVVNNMFSKEHRYPCCSSPEGIEVLRHYLEEPDGDIAENAELLSNYYAGVKNVSGEYLIAPMQYRDDLNYEEILFFDEADLGDTCLASRFRMVSTLAASVDFIKYRLELSSGNASSACFLVEKSALDKPEAMRELLVVISLLNELGVQYEVILEEPFSEKQPSGDNLLPMLRRYWGDGARYRDLLFYRNPDTSTELINISQGAIAEQIVEEVVKATTTEDPFQNMFITAPTGAGKSLLFQLPAIYLAEKMGLVTLVVEPTKALMNDQVYALRDRGVRCAAALNSDISYAERLDITERIKAGDASIIYLSPELLLSNNISDLLGGRRLGLVVVDEAHTVSLWGKDFRSDYWFLGDYLSKLRNSGMRFPIMCLTATAVYGGVDDVVFETIEELELGAPKLFIGSVRRDDIAFNINVLNKAEYSGPIDMVKTELASDRIEEYIRSGGHVLMYCPFRSHVNGIHDSFSSRGSNLDSGKVMKFHAGLDSDYRKAAERRFKDGSCRLMICTKAYGMGVDVDDITDIYHFAPTGNLADYIQEIGRGGRRRDVSAVATIDFFHMDSRYYAQLYSMSSLRLKQLREIMKKLFQIYNKSRPRKQNFLVSPDSFTYLFGEGSEAVNKTKSALMMIARDLESKYGFPVVIVRSKPSYTKNYVCIPDSVVDEFSSKYGKYAKRVYQASRGKTLALHNGSKKGRPITARSVGDTFEVDMARIWEDDFSDKTFAAFKRDFFEGEIMKGRDGLSPSMRQRLEIRYGEDFDIVVKKFNGYMKAIEAVFGSFRQKGREFSAKEFKRSFLDRLEEQNPFGDFTEQILAAFVKDVSGTCRRSTIRVLAKRQGRESPDPRYVVQDKAYINIQKKFERLLNRCEPFGESRSYVTYLSSDKVTKEEFELATLLELFGLATYEARGGKEPEIFIRLNDPSKVQALANDPRYRNSELDRLNLRHHNAKNIITSFFTKDMDDGSRWDLIEKYFIGDDDYVAEVLGLDNSEGKMKTVSGPAKKAKKTGGNAKEVSVSNEGTSLKNMPYSEIWKYVAADCEYEWEERLLLSISDLTANGSFEKPNYGAEITIPSEDSTIACSLMWPKSKVLLFLEEDIDAYERAVGSEWNCHLASQELDVGAFVDAIRMA